MAGPCERNVKLSFLSEWVSGNCWRCILMCSSLLREMTIPSRFGTYGNRNPSTRFLHIIVLFLILLMIQPENSLFQVRSIEL